QGIDRMHGRVRFFWAGEGGVYIPDTPDPEVVEAIRPPARQAYDFLGKEGALSTRAIQSALGLGPGECEQALLELLLAGLVTNDRPEVVRSVVAGQFGVPESEGIRSSLDAELSDWRTGRRPTTLHRPTRTEMRAGRRRAGHRTLSGPVPDGRWSLIHRYGVLGSRLDATEQALAQARQVLQCDGIVTREVVEQQRGMLPWAALYPHFYRMELTGEVRRGYFVRGLSGLQYALPEALDSLRQWARADAPGRNALVLMNASDPALVYGRAVPGAGSEPETEAARLAAEGLVFARIPSNYVVLLSGVPVLVYEHGGSRWQSRAGVRPEAIEQAVTLLLAHLTRPGGLAHRPRRVSVASWNGGTPIGTEIGVVLSRLGFRRDTPGMVWDGL
ncbi:MAG: Lhr family helicase, partial [Anaerolineae bacterium]